MPDASVKSRQLSPVTVSQQEELHVRDLIGSDQARALQVAQVPQIDNHRPVLVAGTLAIPLQTSQRLLHCIARASQRPAGDSEESGLSQRACRPQSITLPAEPGMRRLMRSVQRERQPNQNINVEEKTHGDAPLRAPPSPTRQASHW